MLSQTIQALVGLFLLSSTAGCEPCSLVGDGRLSVRVLTADGEAVGDAVVVYARAGRAGDDPTPCELRALGAGDGGLVPGSHFYLCPLDDGLFIVRATRNGVAVNSAVGLTKNECGRLIADEIDLVLPTTQAP